MELVKDIVSNYRVLPIVKSARTQRGDLLDSFLGKLNASRIDAGYRPYSIAGLNKMFSDRKMSESDIYIFYTQCKSKGKWFSWWFSKEMGLIKTKK